MHARTTYHRRVVALPAPESPIKTGSFRGLLIWHKDLFIAILVLHISFTVHQLSASNLIFTETTHTLDA